MLSMRFKKRVNQVIAGTVAAAMTLTMTPDIWLPVHAEIVRNQIINEDVKSSKNTADFNADGITLGTSGITENDYSTQVYNGHTYAVIDTPMTWTEADEYCKSIGGHLITITDKEENEFFINDLFSQTSQTLCWLGGYYNRTQRKWQWVTDESFTYTNWDVYMPDHSYYNGSYEDYMMTYKKPNYGVRGSQAYKWNDIFENGIYPGQLDFFNTKYYCFVCEWDYILGDNNNTSIGAIADYAVFSANQNEDMYLVSPQ